MAWMNVDKPTKKLTVHLSPNRWVLGMRTTRWKGAGHLREGRGLAALRICCRGNGTGSGAVARLPRHRLPLATSVGKRDAPSSYEHGAFSHAPGGSTRLGETSGSLWVRLRLA